MTKSLYITIISMLCALLFLNMRCKKENEMDPNGLPKATQVGSLLFACKINGENWTSNKNSYSVSGGVKNGIITVSGFNDSNSARGLEYLQFQVKEVASQMVYRLNDPISGHLATYKTDRDCFTVVSFTNRADSSDGEVSFTRIDKANRVVSGTFWCNIPTEKCGVIKITDGRFDIRY